MALDFPANPTVNQTYTYGDRTWTWTGTTWSLSGTGSGSPTGTGATGPTGPTGPRGATGVGVAASGVQSTTTPRDLALYGALSDTDKIVRNPDPGTYQVTNDPWPFSGFSSFASGSRYLWRDVNFRIVGQTPTDASQWNRGVKIECNNINTPKKGLTAIGGTIFTNPAYMPELTTPWSTPASGDKRSWHNNAAIEVDVEDFTLIGTTIYNVGDGITAGISTDPTPDVRPKRLKLIGLAFDAPDDFELPAGAPASGCSSRAAFIHDDAFELDNYEDTLIDDCLVNGAYDCVSIRHDGYDDTADYRDRTVEIKNSLFRSAPVYTGHDTTTYGHWVHGPWFKCGSNPSSSGYRPNLIVTDSVFYAPGDGGMLPEWDDPWDLPVNQGGGQIVSAERCTIIWPNEPFPYRTHWDAYGTDITYIDDISPEQALAEWNRLADAWRARHVPLDTGRSPSASGAGSVGSTGATGPAFTGPTGPTGPQGLPGADAEGMARINVTDYGAAADAVTFTGASINAGSNSLTNVANAAASWIGKTIIVAGAAAASANLYTTVSNVVGTTVTLADTATTARSGGGAYGVCGTDSTTAFTNAITAARTAGTAAFVPPSSTYGFLLTGGIFNLSASDLVGPKLYGAGKDLSRVYVANTSAASIMSGNGSFGSTATYLTAQAAKFTKVLTVNSTTGFSAGDYIGLMDANQPILGTDNYSTSALAGEFVRIKTIDSGTQMTLHSSTTWTYPSGATSTVKRLRPMIGWHVEGIEFMNPLPLAQSGSASVFTPAWALGINLIDCRFRDLDGQAFRPQQSVRVRVRGCEFVDCHSDDQTHLDGTTGLAYPINIGYCHDTIVENCIGTRCRHLVTTVSSATAIMGRNLLVSNCIARDMIESSFDCHAGFDHITYLNCQAHNASHNSGGSDTSGFQIRGPRCAVIDCDVNGHGVGVRLECGADDAIVTGNRFDNVAIGVIVNSSDNAHIINNVVTPTVSAVSVGEDTHWNNHNVRMYVDQLYVNGNPSAAVLDFTASGAGLNGGRWANTFTIGRIYAPDATTLTVGRSNYTIGSAATITIPESSDVFHVTGTTGISNAVPGRPGRIVTLIFDGVCVLTSGSAFVVAGSPHTTTANETLTFASDGAAWRQVSGGAGADVELIQDTVNSMLILPEDSALTKDYNDAAGTLTLDVAQGTIVGADPITVDYDDGTHQLTIGLASGTMIGGSGIQLVYDDVGHTMTISATGVSASTINGVTDANYTFVLADAGKLVNFSNDGGAVALTVPGHGAVAFPAGTRIDIAQIGTSPVTATAGSNASILATPGTKLRARYSGATLIYTGDLFGTSYWLMVGDLSA